MRRELTVASLISNEAQMPYQPSFDTAVGNIHGGVGALLLDSAMVRPSAGSVLILSQWFAGALNTESYLVTATLNVVYLRPTVKTGLRAVGKLIRGGKSQFVVEGQLFDDSGQLCSQGLATFTTPQPSSRAWIPSGFLEQSQTVDSWCRGGFTQIKKRRKG